MAPGERNAANKQVRTDAQRNRARILAAAEAVFAEHGPSASTEQVARRAGVAVGTVFRHFPTKKDLLVAIVKELMRRLAEQAHDLIETGEPGSAFYTFFDSIVTQAAAQSSVLDLLSGTGVQVDVAASMEALREAVAALLDAAQRSGTVRAEVRPAEVMALLTATSQAALRAGWNAELCRRTLAVLHAGFAVPGR